MEIQFTADGSHTLFLPEMNEHYHSVNGAVQESRHVYIEAGFNRCPKSLIHVLEMGFGTGLNALLTALEAEKRRISTLYTALEKYPLPAETTHQLNYDELAPEIFRKIHATEWETPIPITPFFTLRKIQTDFSAYTYPGCYDVVYYDAFAPDKQTEVWSQSLFDTIYNAMQTSGILTTYCAKGHIRRMMQRAGFAVERIPGPPGKREMLRAFCV
ncbi:hypothetical protein FACS189413_13190 [Bacteroidia bacterium]|nr:hypothetical protein FACS189413_13190 [Bacteroidia bacterium]